ncbi:MAG: dienelactone hydrolase family protein [Candidatus Woesebacteria bacterium]
MNKTICIGSSVSFYKDVAKVRRDLVDLGFNVFVPDVALAMEQADNFDVEAQRAVFQNLSAEKKKQIVIHLFEKIEKSDAFLVVNQEKHGIKGYIGPNVLMEITIAVYLGKPVFLLSSMGKDLAAFEEISAIQPISIDNDVSKIRDFFA